MSIEQKIKEQKEKVFNQNSNVTLFAPCKIGEGIIQLDDFELTNIEKNFYSELSDLTFFIPASGSGSRMFQFLYDFLENIHRNESGEMERFMNHLKDFAFFHKLPIELKETIEDETVDAVLLAKYLLDEKGLGFSCSPKGLIPFHFNDPVVLNAFQEHIIQGVKVANGKTKFHFTIQPEFEVEIKQSLAALERMTGTSYDVQFSFQEKSTDSIAFKEDGEPLINSEIVTRPSGHGALLQNLNSIESEYVFIKNIDNVQHYSAASHSYQFWTSIGSLLKLFLMEAKLVFQNPTKEGIISLNAKFQFLSPNQLNELTTPEKIKAILNRPTRVCGMVKNEGQPGGGPFWIDVNGVISKQIIEKAQITQRGEQFNLMIKSTHFNPVMIALSTRSFEGNKFDLTDYVDENQFFIVNKSFQGQRIKYMETPGLWNGGMANWNTLFVEAPKDCFSPVKTVLDLLLDLHLKK